MINKFFSLLKRFVLSAMLIYSYDLICFSSKSFIAVNFFTISFVSCFGFFAMIGLIFLSFNF